MVTEGKFPMKELLPIFTSLPQSQTHEGLACWNLLKEYYSEIIIPSTLRMFDLHFHALVRFVDFHTCVVTTYESGNDRIEKDNQEEKEKRQKRQAEEEGYATPLGQRER